MGHMGRGWNPGQSGIIPKHIAFPIQHGNNREITINFKFPVKEFCQLANRHAMAVGNGIHPHERKKAFLHQIPFNGDAPQRIGAVQHNHFFIKLGGGFHHFCHGINECISPDADVLNIDHQHIQVLQHLCRGLAVFSVQAEDRQFGMGIHFITDFFPGIDCPANAMLRPEEGGEVYIRMLKELVGGAV